MRKFLLLFIAVIALVSCEYDFDWDCRTKQYYPNTGLSLHEEDLWGTWQSSDLKFGNNDVKEFVISRKRPGEANVNLQTPPYTTRFNKTYYYLLDGKMLTFVSKYADEYGQYDGPYKFKVLEMYTCEVILQDCGNGRRYTIACRSACSGY